MRVRSRGDLRWRSAASNAAPRFSSEAYYDGLTGLPNRQLFKDRLEREIAHARRTQTRSYSSISTSTGSRTSTIRWAILQAMNCCAESANSWSRNCARRHAGAAGRR